MGLSWFMRDAEITADSFFHYLPNNLVTDNITSNKESIEFLKQKLLDKKIVNSGTQIREYIDLCENEKDLIIGDLSLLVKQSFSNSKLLKPPTTKDFITKELENLAKDIIEIRKLLIAEE